MEKLTIVTTCKGRIEHALRAVPTWSDFPVVFVDYDCPQLTGKAILAAGGPKVSVIFERNKKWFNLSKARNIAIPYVRTPWVMFLDCDMIMKPGFKEHIYDLLEEKTIYEFEHKVAGFAGTIICTVDDFIKVEGFDEDANGYGYEDSQFKNKMYHIGSKVVFMNPDFFEHIAHSEVERVQHYEIKHPSMSHRNNVDVLNRKFSEWQRRYDSERKG